MGGGSYYEALKKNQLINVSKGRFMDGHLPSLGWSSTSPRMVTHQNKVYYRLRQIKSGQVKPGQVKSGQIKSGMVKLGQFRTGNILGSEFFWDGSSQDV